MTIKLKLTMQFVLIVAVITAGVLFAIYLLSDDYREEDYYDRLEKRSLNIARFLIDVDEIDEYLLYRIERDNPVKLNDEAIRIFNFENELIFLMDEDQIMPVDTELINQVRLDSNVRFKKGDREYLGFLFTSRFDRFVVVISAIDVYGNRKIKNLRTVSFVVFGVSLLLAFIGGRVYAGQALQPIQRIIDQVGKITPADLTKRLDEGNGQDELAQLTFAFNNLLNRVETAFKTQKNFIANASHEMRTPLTAISGQLEVLSLKDREVEEYKETVHSVLDDIRSLNRLSDRLLLLAQTESAAQLAAFTNVRVDDILWQCQADLKKLKKKTNVTIEFDESIDDPEQLVVWGSDQLIRSVISNLMENGCKYSADHSSHVSLKRMGDYIHLIFTDKGIGIPEQEIKYIALPFFRGSNARTKSGHGIGLSLVARIVEIHNGFLDIQSKVDEGTVITVKLPISKTIV